jgi:hypothetical protein
VKPVNPNTVINFIESKFDVSLLIYKGINFWPIVRRELLLDLTYETTSLNALTFEPLIIKKKLINTIKLSLYSLIDSIVHQKINTEVLFHGYPEISYKQNKEGLYYNQYIDPYYELIANTYKASKFALSSAMPNKTIKYQQNIIFIKDSFIKRIAKLKCDKEFIQKQTGFNTIRPLVDAINDAVAKEYNLKPIQNKIFTHLEDVRFYTFAFDLILKRNKIKFVVSECMYDTMNFALVLACKKHKIPVIEVQHGVIEDSVYSPYAKDVDYTILPNYIWVWSNRDKKYLESHSRLTKNLMPLTLGNAWMDKQISIINKEQLAAIKNELALNYTKIICVTMQPGYPLPQFVLDKIIQLQNCLFLIRKHPNTNEQELNHLQETLKACNNVRFSLANISTLLETFYISDLHITHSSAAAIEALALNISTAIVSTYGQPFFQDYIDEKLMTLSLDGASLEEAIQTSRKIKLDNTSRYNVLVDKMQVKETFNNILLQCAA